MRNLLLKYEKTGTVEDQPKCGRPKKLTDRAKTTILHLRKKDPFRPATSITDELNVNYGISVSVSTVKRTCTLADFGMYGRNLFLVQLTEKSVCNLPLNTKIGRSKTGVKSSFQMNQNSIYIKAMDIPMLVGTQVRH